MDYQEAFTTEPIHGRLKADLPVTYVLHARGKEPSGAQGSDVLYQVPWRSDSTPSLACYPSGKDSEFLDRWRDLARREGGDIFDLICRLDDCEFPEALDSAEEMLAQMRASDWRAPVPPSPKQAIDADAWAARHAEAPENLETIRDWLAERDDQISLIDHQWLHDKFGVKWYDGALQVPYIDMNQDLHPGKRRPPNSKMLSLPGSTFNFLYGEHLLKPGPVILCEGETDVWTAAQRLPQFSALGLPTGAGSSPDRHAQRYEWTHRRVILAFDSDEAGRDAAKAWGNHLLLLDAQVEILRLPEGRDLSEVVDLSDLSSQPYRAPMSGLVKTPKGYLREKSKAPASDFVVTPLRVMRSPRGGASYEVTVGLNPKPEPLLKDDLSTNKRLQAWAHERDLNWLGNDTDLATLRSMLRSEASFIPQEEASDVVGLYRGHLVWAEGCYGERQIRYVPSGVHAPMDIRLPKVSSDSRPQDILQMILQLDRPEVIHPMLAWSAVAPVRQLFDRFPILNVSGVSGSGKTTVTEAVIPALTGSHSFQTLTSTTPFAVEAVVHTTNAFPVIFDEYRSGARPESLARLDQLARDAYTMTPSRKAGGDNWETIREIRTAAPIVIIGEQSMVEVSHIERMILVRITRTEHTEENRQALETLKTLLSDGSVLASSYLNWLMLRTASEGHAIPDPPASRIDYNLAVLHYGWSLLQRYALPFDLTLPEPSFEMVETQAREAATHNPLQEALLWAMGDRNASLNVWKAGKYGMVYVNVGGFLADVKRAGVFTLPGYTTRTIQDLLKDQYGASRTKAESPMEPGRQKRVWSFHSALLESGP